MKEEIINPLESGTIRNAAIGMIIHVITIVAVVTGKVFDIEFIKVILDNGYIVLMNAVAMWLEWKAIQGRMKATEMIGGNYAEKLRSK